MEHHISKNTPICRFHRLNVEIKSTHMSKIESTYIKLRNKQNLSILTKIRIVVDFEKRMLTVFEGAQ